MEDKAGEEAGGTQEAQRPWMYTLNNREPVPLLSQDPLEWAEWMEQARRSGAIYVANTRIVDFRISTVFLGLDHQLLKGAPVVFETMVFYVPNDGKSYRHYAAHPFEDYCERYSTWLDAVAGHTRAVDHVLRRDPVL